MKKNRQVVVVGMIGRSGSGKSYFSNYLYMNLLRDFLKNKYYFNFLFNKLLKKDKIYLLNKNNEEKMYKYFNISVKKIPFAKFLKKSIYEFCGIFFIKDFENIIENYYLKINNNKNNENKFIFCKLDKILRKNENFLDLYLYNLKYYVEFIIKNSDKLSKIWMSEDIIKRCCEKNTIKYYDDFLKYFQKKSYYYDKINELFKKYKNILYKINFCCKNYENIFKFKNELDNITRKIYQFIGTDIIRNFVSEKFWIYLSQINFYNFIKNNYKFNNLVIIIDDIRFKNEYFSIKNDYRECVKELDMEIPYIPIIFNITSSKELKMKHQSEEEINKIKKYADYTIFNSITNVGDELENFYKIVLISLGKFKKVREVDFLNIYYK